jgi:hypothetical protein
MSRLTDEIEAMRDFDRLPAHIVLVAGKPHVETPEGHPYGLVRVFTSLSDAARYKAWVADSLMVFPNGVSVATFGDAKDLFLRLGETDEGSRKLFGLPLRLDLCKMDEEEFPKSLSVLFCPFSWRH